MRTTLAERMAIDDLRSLAKRWPKTLMLFSWSGTLCVIKPSARRTMGQANVAIIEIPNDGGDPNGTDPSQ